MSNRVKIFLIILFLVINTTVYILTKINSDNIIEHELQENLTTLQTHYEILYTAQKNISYAIHKSILRNTGVKELLNTNISKQEQAKNRAKLHSQLIEQYETAKKQGILQLQFVDKDNISFLRMHKPDKFGDDLTDIRDDFKYTNETKKPIRAFVQGRVAHGFRNVFPISDENNTHIGAMEISFSSDRFELFLNKISHLHAHFLVNKKVFHPKTWKRDDLAIKYRQSNENKNYMLSYIHLPQEKCISEDILKLEKTSNEIALKMSLGKAFSSYEQNNANTIIFSFFPIHNLANEHIAWLATYKESSTITSTLYTSMIIRGVMFVLSLLIIYFLSKQIHSKQKIHKKSIKLKKTTQLLQKALNEQESILEVKTTGFVRLKERKILWINKAMEEMFGYEEGELIDKPTRVLYLNDTEYERYGAEGYPTLEEHGIFTSEFQAVKKSGAPIVVLASMTVLKGTEEVIGVCIDITEQKRNEEALHLQKEEAEAQTKIIEKKEQELQKQHNLFDIVLNATNNIMFITDFKNIQYSNEKFKELPKIEKRKKYITKKGEFIINCLFSQECDLATGCQKNFNLLDLFVVADGYIHKELLKENESFMELLMRVEEKDRVVSVVNGDFEQKAFTIDIKELEYNKSYLITLSDITQIQENFIETEKKAYIDGLTGVYNRNKFDEAFEQECKRAKRYATPFSIALIDIDNFKDFNDNYGHLIGDEVLITMAQTLNNHIRESDIFARWGGEEFVILFIDTEVQTAEKISNKLRAKISDNRHETAGRITASFGLSQYKEGDTMDSIFKRCDDALYRAKKNGRNRVEV